MGGMCIIGYAEKPSRPFLCSINIIIIIVTTAAVAERLPEKQDACRCGWRVLLKSNNGEIKKGHRNIDDMPQSQSPPPPEARRGGRLRMVDDGLPRIRFVRGCACALAALTAKPSSLSVKVNGTFKDRYPGLELSSE